MAVQAVLEDAGIAFEEIELGWAKLPDVPTAEQEEAIEKGLARFELSVIRSRSAVLVELIKTEIIRLLHSRLPRLLKLSAHLSQSLNYNYTYLANTFSEYEGITLERYFISQRVERVKEMIVYEDLSLNEIADELSYSSVSHLCLQFKKVTNQTPAEFRKKAQSENFVWRKL